MLPLPQVHHPDKVAADRKAEAEIRFKDLTEAYVCLSDATKRARYDLGGTFKRPAARADGVWGLVRN